jgi:hypothetical protein
MEIFFYQSTHSIHGTFFDKIDLYPDGDMRCLGSNPIRGMVPWTNSFVDSNMHSLHGTVFDNRKIYE